MLVCMCKCCVCVSVCIDGGNVLGGTILFALAHTDVSVYPYPSMTVVSGDTPSCLHLPRKMYVYLLIAAMTLLSLPLLLRIKM